MQIDQTKDNGLTQLALEFKRIRYNDDRQSRKRLDAIIMELKDKTIGLLRKKQKGVSQADLAIIEELYLEQLLYALDKWKARSPFLPYFLSCVMSIKRNYITELSPVNNKNCTDRQSFDDILESIYEKEMSVDYDGAGLMSVDDYSLDVEFERVHEVEEEVEEDDFGLDD